MNISNLFKTSGVAAVLLTLGACVSNPPGEILTAEPASVSTTASLDQPAAPPTTATISAEELVAPPTRAPTQKEGVLATIDKMEENPLTLYWRESNSYTYTIGSRLKAEYKPGEGLVVQEAQEGNELECKYSEGGKLDTTGLDAAAAEKAQKACGELMFTFDKELSD